MISITEYLEKYYKPENRKVELSEEFKEVLNKSDKTFTIISSRKGKRIFYKHNAG